MGRQLRRTHLSVVASLLQKNVELAVDWGTLQCVTKGFSTGLHPTKRYEEGRVAQWQMPVGDNPVRTAVRFPMRLAIRLQTDEGEMEAMTENISANGLLFVGEKLPRLESRIEFTIAMPSAGL